MDTPQILDTGRFGQIQVVQTWLLVGRSLCKLVDGSYCHTSGLPISSEKELVEFIPPGPDRDAALHWFRHRHDEPAEQGRRIVMNPDGSYEFDNGDPIESISEITRALKPGPHQEVVIRWFIAQTEKKTKPPPSGWQEEGREEKPPEQKPPRRRGFAKKSKAAAPAKETKPTAMSPLENDAGSAGSNQTE
jgi:hypothetical protein